MSALILLAGNPRLIAQGKGLAYDRTAVLYAMPRSRLAKLVLERGLGRVAVTGGYAVACARTKPFVKGERPG